MARKNKRARHHSPRVPILHTSPKSRCCYCGRILYPDAWHYMWDEYGQRVKKCNDELECYRHRKDRAEETYRNAIREKQFNR